MSAGAPSREVAHRLFAVEFDDATVSHTESDEDMAPSYVVTPTGAMVNRAFVVGTLTSVDQVGDDIYRGRVADPTETFVTYAGQYQPSPANFLAEATPPQVVAVTGKARTFQPDGSDDVLSSLRPERIVETTPQTRDRWVSETARHTLGRVELLAAIRATGIADDAVAEALTEAEVPHHVATGIQLAIEAYDPSPAYLAAIRQRAIQALEVVSDERESVDFLDVEPDEDDGSTSFDELSDAGFVAPWLGAEIDLSGVEVTQPEPEPAADVDEESTGEPPEPTAQTDDDAVDEPPEPPEDEPPVADPPEAAVGGGEPADELYEFSDEERAEVEDEFGVDFETGSEIDSSQESPVDEPPTPPEPDIEPEAGDDPVEPEDDTDDEDDTPTVDTLVIEFMRELDDGDGADRHDLIDAVVDESGASREAVDDAIQDALMSGTCYEPTEDRLKPI